MGQSGKKTSIPGVKYSSRTEKTVTCHRIIQKTLFLFNTLQRNKYRENGGLHAGFGFCRKFL